MSQQSIKASCKTNLPSLLQSTFPIWIYLPYWYLTSLLASNHHTNLFTSILYHYSYLTEEPSKPSCIFNLTSLPITPIYYPYLITNLLPLPVSNTPTCITTQHTHMYTSWSWQILILLILMAWNDFFPSTQILALKKIRYSNSKMTLVLGGLIDTGLYSLFHP